MITTSKIPFKFEPDVPEELEGRLNWAKRNYEFHRDKAESLRLNMEHQQMFMPFGISPPFLPKQMKEEEEHARKHMDACMSIEASMEERMKNYFLIKNNLFAAALFFYIYTSEKDSFQDCLAEIESRKYSAKMEISKTYFVRCSDVKEPFLVFNPEFPPFSHDCDKYYCIALANDCSGFSSDKDVAIALKHFFTTTLELPKEIEVKEEIIMPEEQAVSVEGPRSIFLGNVVRSVVRRQGSKQKAFFPMDLLVKHALIIGSTGKGKTWFAMFLAMQAAQRGVKVLVVDPHGTFRFLGQHPNVDLVFVNSSEEVMELLRNVYDEALKQPIQREAELKKLIIIDEPSAGKLGKGIREIMKIVDACFSELRKFGYGMVLIAQYATDNRAISTNVRENAETYFIFRKKTLSELERIKTLKHPSLDIIPFLPERYCMVYSEDYYPEPFFIRVPRLMF